MQVNDDLLKRFMVKTSKKPTKPGCWDCLLVEVFDGAAKVGEYLRDYPSLFSTFHPFQKGDKCYALYSSSYMYTRVMSLPDCTDIGGEDAANTPYKNHFCPTGYAVPFGEYCVDEPTPVEPNRYVKRAFDADFGFVCGCIWGDDSSWKIQYLDLSDIKHGVLRRDARMGYIELLNGADSLAASIDLEEWEPGMPHVRVTGVSRFDLGKLPPKSQ
jgi:hypothetical protein